MRLPMGVLQHMRRHTLHVFMRADVLYLRTTRRLHQIPRAASENPCHYDSNVRYDDTMRHVRA